MRCSSPAIWIQESGLRPLTSDLQRRRMARDVTAGIASIRVPAWADIAAVAKIRRIEAQFAAAHAGLDMPEQIFIGGNAARGGPGGPFNIKRAFGFHAREFGHRPTVGHDVAIAPEAGEMAAAQGERRKSQKFRRSKRPDRDGVHRNWISFE